MGHFGLAAALQEPMNSYVLAKRGWRSLFAGVFIITSGLVAALDVQADDDYLVTRPWEVTSISNSASDDTEARTIDSKNPLCKDCARRANAHREVTRSKTVSALSATPIRRLSRSIMRGPRQPTAYIAPGCFSRIMDANGNVNSVGQKLVRAMGSERNKRYFLANSSLASVCPKFKSMNNEQKLKAWTWFWLSLAQEESGGSQCSPSTYHRPPPHRGIGIWASEFYGQNRNWRGRDCRGDITRVDTQVTCTVSTMVNTQLKKGFGAIYRNTYWGPINRATARSPFLKNMRRYTPCG